MNQYCLITWEINEFWHGMGVQLIAFKATVYNCKLLSFCRFLERGETVMAVKQYFQNLQYVIEM